MAAPVRVPRLAADLALLAVAAFWGVTFPLGKIVLEVLPPFTYLAARFTMGAVMLVAGTQGGRIALAQREWPRAAAVGAVFFAGYALQTTGLGMTTASKAAFITGLSTAMVPVISAVWMRRPAPPRVLFGVAAAMGGLALLALDGSGGTSPGTNPGAGVVPGLGMSPGIDPGVDMRLNPGMNPGMNPGINLGDLLVLGCAFCFALHIVLVGRLARRLDPPAFAAGQVVPVMALSTLAAASERSLPALVVAPPVIWGAIVFMALTGTVAALVVQNWAQRFTSPSHVGLMFTFEPVAAAAAAYLLLGELFTGRQAVGAFSILVGILMAETGGRGT
jgi:drug/metabolite transporter (DMT)-like permease